MADDLVNAINKTQLCSDIFLLDLEDHMFNEEYLVNMWKYFLSEMGVIEKEDFEPLALLYKLVKCYFTTLFNSNDDTVLHFVPNRRGMSAIVIMKKDDDFTAIDLYSENKLECLTDLYVRNGIFGNIVAIYFTK